MGNKNLIITIEREYGSGGRIVGRKLAEDLGIHFYDDEILKLTSEKSAIGEEYFRLADEKAGNNLLHRIVAVSYTHLGKGNAYRMSIRPYGSSAREISSF